MACQEGISTADQLVTPNTDTGLETKYMLDTMDQDEQLRSVADLFRKAGTDGYLYGSDLLTRFAPRPEALAGIETGDADRLSNIPRGHILARAVTEDDLRTATELESLERKPAGIERGGTSTRAGGATNVARTLSASTRDSRH